MARRFTHSMIRTGGPGIKVTDIESLHPGSVWASLIAHANWLSNLDISNRAKRLTRLRGRHFVAAVNRILAKRS